MTPEVDNKTAELQMLRLAAERAAILRARRTRVWHPEDIEADPMPVPTFFAPEAPSSAFGLP